MTTVKNVQPFNINLSWFDRGNVVDTIEFAKDVYLFHKRTVKNSFAVINRYVYPIVAIAELKQKFYGKEFHISYVFRVRPRVTFQVEKEYVNTEMSSSFYVLDGMVFYVVVVDDNEENNKWIDENIYGRVEEEKNKA